MKVVITGGHLSPAFSVIEAFPKNTEVLIIGRKHAFEGDSSLSPEAKVALNKNILFRTISAGRLQRSFSRYTIPSLIRVPKSFIAAFAILKDYKPDVVVSFGGYVSLPVVFAAKVLSIPIVIHEQTLSVGLANKLAAKVASKICVSWESSIRHFPYQKVVLTGNPIRKFQYYSSSEQLQQGKHELPLVYITGGSTGSHTINSLVLDSLEKLLEQVRIIHQTGNSQEFGDFAKLDEKRKKLPQILKDRYIAKNFISQYELGKILSNIDFAVCRSGINTVSELLFFGKPAILIPLNNEQLENAHFFTGLGMGFIESQDDLTSDKFVESVRKMVKNISQYSKNSPKAKTMINLEAAKLIVAEIEIAANSVHEKKKI